MNEEKQNKYELHVSTTTMNSEEPVQIEPDNFRAGIIIGGGTCGLAVASRLCENHPGSLFTEDEHQRFHWLKQRGHKTNKVKTTRGLIMISFTQRIYWLLTQGVTSF